jgi:hypothetical protein
MTQHVDFSGLSFYHEHSARTIQERDARSSTDEKAQIDNEMHCAGSRRELVQDV